MLCTYVHILSVHQKREANLTALRSYIFLPEFTGLPQVGTIREVMARFWRLLVNIRPQFVHRK